MLRSSAELIHLEESEGPITPYWDLTLRQDARQRAELFHKLAVLKILSFSSTSTRICWTLVHSPVFSWIVEHATDILNKCHVASDGKSACERLKRRRVLLPFGAAVMFRVAGKVPGGVMTERWRLGTWLGQRFHTEEHCGTNGRWSCDQIKGSQGDA